jgi:AraC-like DNA-binding protein
MQYIIGIFIAFFLAVLILTKKGRNRADTILGIWMIITGLHLFGYYSFVSEIIYIYPFLMWMNLPYAFVHGPMLYLYTEALTNPERFKSKTWLLHFVLPVLMVLTLLPIMLMPENERIMLYRNNGKGFEDFLILDWTIPLSISGIIYIVITNILLYKHKKRILNQFSNQEKINLNWLRFLFYGMGVTWMIIIFGGSDKLIFSMSSIFLIFIGYFGIKQVGIFTDYPVELPENKLITAIINDSFESELRVDKKKYAKSGLNEDTANVLHQQLKNLMETERLFIEPELTLTDLAIRLDVHPNYLSQVINELEGVNFYDYINTLRVEEFKSLVLLPQNQKYTLLALAYDCGFNSKTAFNRFFKKATDLSPSDYLKTLS